MHRSTPSFAHLLRTALCCWLWAMVCTSGFAQSSARCFFSFSLWPGFAEDRVDTTRLTRVDVGLYSLMHRLGGVGLNAFGSKVMGPMAGVQLSGLFNYVGGEVKGLQWAGLTNFNRDAMSGLSLAGLVNATPEAMRGVSVAGLVNAMGEGSTGVAMAGLINLSANDFSGLNLSGMANIAGSHSGLATSGLLNLASRNMRGVQWAGVGNVVGEDMRGVQLSALGNVAGGEMRGLQMGIINVSTTMRGLQMGVVNLARQANNGLQMGLINLNPHTRYQLLAYGGNDNAFNLGVRFRNRSLYTIVGLGTGQVDVDPCASLSAIYRAGFLLPVVGRLYIGADAGYQHIETFRHEQSETPHRLYALQGRVNMEYALTSRLGLFVSGGYGVKRRYDQNTTYHRGAIVEGGLVVFSY